MKRFLLVIALWIFTKNLLRAQADTSVVYISDYGKQTTKDSAKYYTRLYQQMDVWYGKTYEAESGKLISEGGYLKNDIKTKTGSFKVYDGDGKIAEVGNYENGDMTEKTFYYPGGKKKSWISYNHAKVKEQKGWDENGQELKHYIVEKAAQFKGGMGGWVSYLEKNLDALVATSAGAPAGIYTVKVKFIIDKEGQINNVIAESVPEHCKPCAREALRVIKNGPRWEPAIQNNVAVIYQARQNISFQEMKNLLKKGNKKLFFYKNPLCPCRGKYISECIFKREV